MITLKITILRRQDTMFIIDNVIVITKIMGARNKLHIVGSRESKSYHPDKIWGKVR